METTTLPARKVLVLGCGLSGLAMARWCARLGDRVTVADTRDAPPQLEDLKTAVPDVRFIAGEFSADLLADNELVLRSPGLSPAQIAPVAAATSERGIPLRGELSLFGAGLAALKAEQGYKPAVLAVTGTNGKTTVTALTAVSGWPGRSGTAAS